jgi:ubiquinone/menaquinone biosynthesis C-methylase UbiE
MSDGHAERMAQTYATGSFSRIVDAGGHEGLMNLGYAADRLQPGSTRARQQELARKVVAALELRAGDRVLDLGCGKGGTAALIARWQPATTTVGVNIDGNQLRGVPTRVAPRSATVQARVEALPLRDASFDKALAIELLSHVGQKGRFAGEVHRVLRGRGLLVMALITLARPYADFGSAHRDHLRRLAGFFAEEPADVPTLTDTLDVFVGAGFELVTTEDLTDGVFVPRFEEFTGMLRRLRHPDARVRRAFAAHARRAWGVSVPELERFLVASTRFHPCRFYEYHLVAWHRGTGGRQA